jgi:histidyl-tRNA synthetase
MSSKQKSQRLKARLPRGFADRRAPEIAATRAMIEKIRAVYERYGFEPVETPAIEYTDALGKFLPDQDRPNEGVFSFQDDDEQWLSLRYDLTAPLARFVAENFEELPKPYRSYREGWVFRNEKPGPGRYRQFMQFDADTVGSSSPAADAEICMMAADTLAALGFERGSYVIKVNNRKVLDGVMESIGLSGEENAGKRLTVLRTLDKYDRLGRAGVTDLLQTGRKDESGDFTRGAGLNDEQVKLLLWFLTLRTSAWAIEEYSSKRFNPQIRLATSDGESKVVDMLSAMEGSDYRASAAFLEGVAELRALGDVITASGFDDGRIITDPSVVRGLEYYTGPVFEAELTFEIKDEKGNPVRFGSVGGGGRYDGLVGRFRPEQIPATGFSIGVSRLQAALAALGKTASHAQAGPVVVTVFDRERLADYQQMVQRLREAGIRAELYLGNGKMGPQLKYADRRGAPCVVIQGGDEKAQGVVQIKDLIEGAKAASAIASHEEYREARPAQFAVPEDKLVDAVRDVLARHGLLSSP